jgi:GT2 family glycosyltransferase
VVVDTSTWEVEHHVQLGDTLRALEAQSYPRDRIEIVVVLESRHAARRDELARAHPRSRIVLASPDLSYYELRNVGARAALGEILAMTDADCVPCPGWVEEIVRSFAEAPPGTAAVQGRTRFLPRPLARAWDPGWWPGSFAAEGPIDRLYTGSNVAFRAEAYRRNQYPAGVPLLSGLERVLGRELRRAGHTLWFNPRMVVHHTYTPRAREIVQQGLVRGYYFMALRRTHPQGWDHLVKRLSVLAPLVCGPALLLKDVLRVVQRARALGLTGRQALKIPLYALLQAPFDLVVMAGMYWAILAPDRVPWRPR